MRGNRIGGVFGLLFSLVWLGVVCHVLAYQAILRPWIEKGHRPDVIVLIFGLVFVGVGVFGVIRAIRDLLRPGGRDGSPISNDAARHDRLRGRRRRRGGRPISKGTARLVVAVVSLAFMAVGFGGVFFQVRSCWRTRSWQPVSATVKSVELESHRVHTKHRSSTVYSPKVAYLYTVDGVSHFGNEFSNCGGATSDYAAQKAKADAYHAGDAVTAWVNPDDPTESVLNRVTTPPLFSVIFFGIFALIGSSLLIFLLRTLSGRRDAVRSYFNATLRPSMSVSDRNLLFFAVLWNLFSWSVAGVFLSGSGFRFSFEMLIIAIFPLVGLGFAFKAASVLARRFCQPQFAVTVTCPQFRPGAQMQVSYEFAGPTDDFSLEVWIRSINLDFRTSDTLSSDPQEGVLIKVHQVAAVGSMGSFAFVVPTVPEANRRAWSLQFVRTRRTGNGRMQATEYALP